MVRPVEEALFRELDHTADVGIEVEAGDERELFRRVGLALFRLMVEAEGVEARESLRESVTAANGPEELLHEWLSRLLVRFLVDGFVASDIRVDRVSKDRIDAQLSGEKLDLERHRFLTEIKAVTWHDLSLQRIDGRWRARVVFDV